MSDTTETTDFADQVPDYQSLMLPVLRAAGQGEVRIGDLVEKLASVLGLSEAARNVLLASGRQTVFANRVHWAKTYLALRRQGGSRPVPVRGGAPSPCDGRCWQCAPGHAPNRQMD